MSRPIYERGKDRDNERRVADWLARRQPGSLRPVQMPKRYPVDFALIDDRGEFNCWLEIKCRTNAIDAYPSYMVSLEKVRGMFDLARFTAIPTRLVVRWEDCLGYLNFPCPYEIRMGGRKDRGDWQDVEPMAHFDVRSFDVLWRGAES